MKNNENMTMNEKLFEAMLKIATDEALREEMENLPSNEELNKMYPRTKSLDKKVNAVFKREFRVARRKKALQTFSRMAAVFSIFTVITGVVLMSVEASRNFILNALIDMRGDYIAFDFGIGDTAIEEDSGMVLGYLPESFELIGGQSLEGVSIRIFATDTGHSLIVQRITRESLFVGVDYEYMEFSEMQLNIGTARVFEATDEYTYSVIMWEAGTDVIKIATTLDFETAVRVAENILVE